MHAQVLSQELIKPRCGVRIPWKGCSASIPHTTLGIFSVLPILPLFRRPILVLKILAYNGMISDNVTRDLRQILSTIRVTGTTDSSTRLDQVGSPRRDQYHRMESHHPR